MSKEFKITVISLIVIGFILVPVIIIYGSGSNLSDVFKSVKRSETLENISKVKCDAMGWAWQPSGCGIAKCTYGCYEVYDDGGKNCNNSNDCKGRCIVDENTDNPVCESVAPWNCVKVTEYNNGVTEEKMAECSM